MAKRNVSEIETGAGFFMGFVNATMDEVREKAVPFAAIYRLATAGGRTTLDKIVDLAFADWQAEQPKTNGGATFSAQVVYAIPAVDELKRRYPAYVDPAYIGIIFEPIKVCEEVSRETREVEFEYVHMGRYASNDDVLAEFNKRGLRPVLPEELLAFDAKYPEEMKKHPIVALGSGTYVYGDRRVAYLWNDDDGRDLCLYWIGGGWDDSCRFLAVRK